MAQALPQSAGHAASTSARSSGRNPEQPTAAPPATAADTIEIEFVRGYRVRIGHGVKAASLRLVLDALERR